MGRRKKAEAKPKKDNELEGTLKEVRKRYGDTSVRKGSQILQPSRISTGIFVLDFATLGGIGCSRSSQIVGERHSGKSMTSNKIIASAQRQFPNQKVILLDTEGCVAFDTRVMDVKTGLSYKAEDIYEGKLGIDVLSHNGLGCLESNPITHWHNNGIKEVYKITSSGFPLKCTGNHRFLVHSVGGLYSWVRADELKAGDLLCKPRHIRLVWGRSTLPSATCELVGMLIGDGSYGPSNTSVVFTNKNKEVLRRIRTLCKSLDIGFNKFSDRHYRLSCDSIGNKYGKNKSTLIHMLIDLGIWGDVCGTKKIPSKIMTGSRQQAVSCLSGLYNTDGLVNNIRPTITYISSSRLLVDQIVYLWARLGISAHVSTEVYSNEKHNDCYRVNINGSSNLKRVLSFVNLVGDRKSRLTRWANTVKKRNGRDCVGDYLPEYYSLTAQERRRVDKSMYANDTDMYYVPVVGIESVGRQQTYDFTVEGSHNYVADWFVVHNTFEGVWAEKLGVDIDQLEVVECETGEMALDIADAVLSSVETSLVVVDSIAAMEPMKERESSAEDHLVAFHAKLIAEFVRKTTSIMIEERRRGHNVTLLNLNQFRCIDKKTRLWTDRGLIYAGNIKVGDAVSSPSGYSLVKATEDNGLVSGVELKIKRHAPLRLSLNHRHIIVSDEGFLEEVLASDMVDGDWVVLSKGTSVISNGNQTHTPLESSFMGMYFADGCVTKSHDRSDYRVFISETCEERGAMVEIAMRDMFNGVGSYAGKNNSVGKPAVDYVNKHNLGYASKSKTIPESILCGAVSNIKTFLAYASFDTHGFQRNMFYWTFDAEYQAYDFASMLLGFGIKADVVKNPSGEYKYLSISSDDACKYRDIIGFSETSKMDRAAHFSRTSVGARGKYDLAPRSMLLAFMDAAKGSKVPLLNIPDYHALYMCKRNNLHASRVRLLNACRYVAGVDVYADLGILIDTLTNYRFAQVEEITPVICMDVIDIEVDGGLFFADGVLTHNSDIGGYGMNPRKIPGGRALGHATSLDMIMKNKENKGKDSNDMETVTHNEHSYTITKNKMNNGPRTGEFTLVREDNESKNLYVGDVDDSRTLLSVAKKFGFYTGAGKNQKLEFLDYIRKYSLMEQAIQELREDGELYWDLRTHIIRTQAAKQGMPKEFLLRIV